MTSGTTHLDKGLNFRFPPFEVISDLVPCDVLNPWHVEWRVLKVVSGAKGGEVDAAASCHGVRGHLLRIPFSRTIELLLRGTHRVFS